MIPENIELKVKQILEEKHGVPVEIRQQKPLSGGDINDAACLVSSAGNYFVKWNSAKRFPGMFAAEAKGLKLLRNADEIYIPEVVTAADAGSYSFLLLEYVNSSVRISNFMENFGQALAALHKHSAARFGLDHNNYIGSLPQSNAQRNHWTAFFKEERLEKQVKMARDHGEIDKNLASAFEKLYKELPSVFPEEPPALLHGDLWSGNFMTAPDGKACIYDPAVYFGHREMDIAMTRLFGGFSPDFYEAYHSAYPLEKGWQQRCDISNLYPLMVHVNLFGGSYVYSVKSTLSRF